MGIAGSVQVVVVVVKECNSDSDSGSGSRDSILQQHYCLYS